MDWLLATIWYLIGVWASTWLARRLLGAPFPLARALGATLLGLVAGLGGAALVRASNPGRELYAVDFAVISLLTTLVLVALLGLLARPRHPGGSRPTIGPPHPLRAVRRVDRAPHPQVVELPLHAVHQRHTPQRDVNVSCPLRGV